jgi:predicted flavoprotein YhiN
MKKFGWDRGSRFRKNINKILQVYTASYLSHRLENLQSSTKSNLLGKIFPQICESRNIITVVRRALFEESLAVTLRATRFYIQEFYAVLTLRLCVLYGSQIKQQHLPYTPLTEWFL